MNRNYKVIWNQSLNCFMAVAEYAKSRGKSSSAAVTSSSSSVSDSAATTGSNLLRLSALCVGLTAAGFNMQAVAAVGTDSIDTDNCATGSAANKSTGNVAIGCSSDASGRNNIAIGGSATTKVDAGDTQGAQSIAIGYDAQTKGDQSIGLGANVRASGNSSIAIGGDDLNSASSRNIDGTSNSGLNSGDINEAFKKFAGRDLVYTSAGASNPNIPDVNRRQYIGTETAGPASVAIGVQAQSVGALSTAFGTQATSIGVGSTALGVSATATKSGSVALGAGAETDSDATSEKTIVIGGKTYNFAGSVLDGAGGPVKTGAQVSVGAAGLERQIKNVAGGKISADSTDAINGSQLAATNSALGDTNTNVTSNTGNIANLTNGRAGIVRQDTGTAPITVGAATGGTSVNLTGTDGVRTLTGLANGSVAAGSSDAITGDQLNATNNNVTTAQTAANNAQTTANTANTTAGNALSKANLGFNISADNGADDNVQLGEAVTFTNTDNNLIATVSDNGINYDLADDISVNQLTVGDATNNTVLTSTANGLDVGGDKITNVADGTIAAGSADAVTGNQLSATNANVATNTGDITTNTGNIATNAGNIAGNTTGIADLANGRIGIIRQDAGTGAITVGNSTGGTSVNLTGTDGVRTLSGLANGNIAAGSTDAITGDQLNTTNTNVTTNANNIAGNTGSIADLTNGRAGIVRQDAGTGAITVGATTGGTSVDFTGSSNGVRTLTGIANGNVAEGSTDAITGDQLNTTNTAVDNVQTTANTANTTANNALTQANRGFDIAANNGTANNIQPGEAVTFTNTDNNLVATVSDNAINYDLADDISVNQLTVGDATNNTVLTSTANGLDVAGDKITNVADGTTASDVATFGQLETTNASVTTNASNIATNTGSITTNTNNIATNTTDIADNRNASQGNVTALGGGAGYDAATDTYTAPTYNLNNDTDSFNNVGDALGNLDTRTTTNTGNIATNATNIAGNTGSIADLTNGRAGILRQDAGTGAITVGAATGGTSVDLTGTDSVRTLSGLADGTIATGSTDAVTGNQLNATNANIDTNANRIIANTTDITENRNVSQGNVTALGANAGYDAATDTYIAPTYTLDDGTNTGVSSDFNNVSDALGNLNTRTADNTGNIATNTGNITTNAGSIADLTNGRTGIVRQDAGTGAITVSATTGGTSVDLTGTDGVRTLSGLADGTIATGSTDAVTGNQLNATNTTANTANTTANNALTQANLGFDIAADNGTANNIQPGEAVTFTNTDNNLVATVSDNAINYDLADDISVNQLTVGDAANSTVLTSTANGLDVGGDKITNVADGTTASDVATFGQLETTNANVTTNANNIATNTGSIADLTNGRAGIVRQDAGTGTITVGATTGGDSVELTGTDGVRTLTGLANGNIAAGSTDAITGDQLNTTNANIDTNANSITANTTDITDNRYASQGNVTALGGNANYDAATDTYTAPEYTVFTNPSNTAGTSSTVNTVGDAITAINTAVQTPLTFAADNGGTIERQLGDTFTISGDSGNITTAATATGVSVQMSATPNFDSVTVNNAPTTSTDVTNKDYVDGSRTSVTSSNSSISVIETADGNARSFDLAVNAQALSDSAQLPVVYTAVDGARLYKQPDGSFNTVANGSGSTVAANNISASVQAADGSTTTPTVLSNIADGELSTTSTDAINGSQLNATNANVTANTGNIATNANNITANTSSITANTADITDNRNVSQGNVTALGGNASYDAANDTYTPPTYTLDDGTNTGTNTAVNNVGNALGNLNTRTADNTGNIAINANNIAGNTTGIADLANGRTGIVRQDTGTGAITVGATTGGTSIDLAGTDGVRTLTGLANGSVASGSTDAITGDQLNTSAAALSTIIGGNAANTSGVITATNIGGTGIDNIDGAIVSVNNTAIKAKSTVTEGDNIVVATTINADGSTNYQVATANNLVLDSLTTGNTVTNNSGVTINDGANVTTLSSTGTTVTDGINTNSYGVNGFTASDNAGNSIIVNQAGLSFNNSAGAIGPSLSATGIDAGSTKISNLEAGTLATDAVNKGQLDAITSNITAGGVQYDRNTDNTVNYDRVRFVGTPAVIGTDENGNNVVVSGGTRLTNIANGINAADAVNKGQLDSATNIKVFDQSGDEVTVNIAEQVANTAVDNNNLDSLFLTYDKSGQKATDRLTIGETVQKMNTEGVKFAHTNAVNTTNSLGMNNDSSAGADNSTAIGVNAIVAADATSTIALGHNTLASDNATNAVVIGKDSQVGGASSIAIGNGSQANGNQSISVGTRNIVNGNNSGAFGDPTIINGNNSYSVGNNNAINSDDTFVLGNNVTQSVNGSVVLGTGSAATTGAGITGYRADTSDANDAILVTTSSTGAVAVGDADNDIYRQVTGVAAGTADSDAVNVAQLRAVDTTLSNLVTGNIGLVQQAGNQNVITIGAATGGTSINVAGTEGNRQITGVAAGTANTDALNVSQLSSVLGGNTTVADNGQVNANLDVGGNQYNTVQDALTAVNSQTGQLNDAAVQYDRDADGSVNQNQITLGGGAEGTLITNVQNGNVEAGSRDAINGGQLNDTADSIASVIGGNATNSGGVITATNIGGTGASTIDGAISSIQQNNASTNTAVSNNAANIASNSSDIQDNTGRLNAGLNFNADSGATINQPIGDNSAVSFVGGDNITTTASDSGIQFDLNGNINVDTVSAQSITTGNTTVDNSGVTIQNGPSMTTNGINAGGNVVTGVADGIDATDAVNFGQLSALDRRLNSNVSELGYKINEVEDEANAGISAAMAMSSLPQAYIPGKSMVGGGIASYNGESAVAIGVSKVSDNGRWVIKANGTADTQGNAGGAIGAGFHF